MLAPICWLGVSFCTTNQLSYLTIFILDAIYRNPSPLSMVTYIDIRTNTKRYRSKINICANVKGFSCVWLPAVYNCIAASLVQYLYFVLRISIFLTGGMWGVAWKNKSWFAPEAYCCKISKPQQVFHSTILRSFIVK